MDKVSRSVKDFFGIRFNLQEGKGEEKEIIESVTRNVDFKGANLFALIFAIFIASIGLNVNSTAVIIGAMLISPIMGPVMGIGLGVGINDLELLKRGMRNLLLATVIGIVASTVYFLISPLHGAQSELLARTSPSIWDVFIAFFGGLAGMVAASRKEKTNVVPGVAIATALMPPLCTVGYGISMGNWVFAVGALYLYFINSVFIAIATYLMCRYLQMVKHNSENVRQSKKVTQFILVIVVITVVPSIFLAYRIVDKSIFEANSRRFVEEQFNFKNTQVVSKKFVCESNIKAINLLLIGTELSKTEIDSIKSKRKDYQLGGVDLVIKQGFNAKQQIDLAQIRTSILEDVFNQSKVNDTVVTPKLKTVLLDTLVFKELQILYPGIKYFGTSNVAKYNADLKIVDSVKVAFVDFDKLHTKKTRLTIEKWLASRYQSPNLKLIDH